MNFLYLQAAITFPFIFIDMSLVSTMALFLLLLIVQIHKRMSETIHNDFINFIERIGTAVLMLGLFWLVGIWLYAKFNQV